MPERARDAALPTESRDVSRWMPRKLRITRQGRYYLAMTLGVGLAAVNTGNNLLFLVLGMLLALIVLSGLLSESALRRLSIGRRTPMEARAGEAAATALVVRSGNRRLPAIGLRLEEVDAHNAAGGRARVLRLGPGETVRVTCRVVPRRRGEVRLTAVRITTGFPFGIFEKSRVIAVPGSFVAWPARGSAPPALPDPGRDPAAGTPAVRGGGEDFHGLRGFRQGDEARHIHWRRSLRVGELLVVEREAPRGRRITLTLPAGAGEAFEAAVRVAAARVEQHLARGDQVALHGPGLSLSWGGGPAHRRRLLTALALAQPVVAPEAAA